MCIKLQCYVQVYSLKGNSRWLLHYMAVTAVTVVLIFLVLACVDPLRTLHSPSSKHYSMHMGHTKEVCDITLVSNYFGWYCQLCRHSSSKSSQAGWQTQLNFVDHAPDYACPLTFDWCRRTLEVTMSNGTNYMYTKQVRFYLPVYCPYQNSILLSCVKLPMLSLIQNSLPQSKYTVM
mgnify:CR=1 FL=1